MARFDHSLAYDQVLQRGIPGQVARVTDPETDYPFVDLYDLEGRPIQALVSNSSGFVQPFQIPDGPARVKLTVGNFSYILRDDDLFGETAEAAVLAAEDARRAADLVEAPPDAVVKTLIEGSGTQTQQAGDARWVAYSAADAVVKDFIEGDGSETQNAGDNRWVGFGAADGVVAEKLGDVTSDAVQALRERITEDADTVPGLIGAADKRRATVGEPLLQRHLDTVVEPGFYNQYTVTYATRENGYPLTGTSMEMSVRALSPTAGRVVQTVTYSATGRKFHRRTADNGVTWTEWNEYARKSDIDERATPISFSEEKRPYPVLLTNTSRITSASGGTLPHLQRSGNTMELAGILRNVVAGATGLTEVCNLPPDARPTISGNANRQRWLLLYAPDGQPFVLYINSVGQVQINLFGRRDANANIYLTASWTVDPPSRWSFERICSRMFLGEDYWRVLDAPPGADFNLFVPHGGEAEHGTSELARAIRAGLGSTTTSLYEWDFLKPRVLGVSAFDAAHQVGGTPGGYKGVGYDDPGAIDHVATVDDCLAIHGCWDGDASNGRPLGAQSYIGGDNRVFAEIIGQHLANAGFSVHTDTSTFPGLTGLSSGQPHNMAKNRGVQIEMSETQRQEFFPSDMTVRANRATTTARFTAYKNAVVAAINEYRGA